MASTRRRARNIETDWASDAATAGRPDQDPPGEAADPRSDIETPALDVCMAFSACGDPAISIDELQRLSELPKVLQGIGRNCPQIYVHDLRDRRLAEHVIQVCELLEAGDVARV